MMKSAIISPCGRYRYCLTRTWGDGPILPIIMLNPSTADASVDDPTIRRCIGFAKREGRGGIVVCNLFGFRATNPADLRNAMDPVGPDNFIHLETLMTAAVMADIPVLCAWGTNAEGREVRQLAIDYWAKLTCLGRTKHGQPRHPLYVPADQPMETFQ